MLLLDQTLTEDPSIITRFYQDTSGEVRNPEQAGLLQLSVFGSTQLTDIEVAKNSDDCGKTSFKKAEEVLYILSSEGSPLAASSSENTI